MKLLITTQQPDINSPVDDRFGRAACFLIVNTDTDEWQAVDNPARDNRGGAGVAAAQFAADHQISAIISGDFGPNTIAPLNAARIKMVRFPKAGLTGKDVIEMVRSGQLEIA